MYKIIIIKCHIGEHRESVHVALLGFQQPTNLSTTTHRYSSTMVQRQPPPKCQKLGPSTEPALMVMSVNIEGLSSAKQQILAELCANHKCDVVCMQETHRWPSAVRPSVHEINLVAHQCEQLVLDVIAKTQHRPIAININAVVSPQEFPFRRRYNIKKSDSEGFAKSKDMGITDIVPTPDNYGSFVDIIKKASRQKIPRGSRTSYICGLTDESKETHSTVKQQKQATDSPTKLHKLSRRSGKPWLSQQILHTAQKGWKTTNKLSKDYNSNARWQLIRWLTNSF